MPTLQEIRNEIQVCPVLSAADHIRRKYLKALRDLTGRPTLLFASCFTVKDAPGDALMINTGDIQSFMSALIGVKGPVLDVILHTSGGVAEATEQIVSYLRAKFSDLRVIVPQNAMSAGTIFACAANRIVMGKHSALGPIDPQLLIRHNGGVYSVAAHSLLAEFQLAQASINTPNTNPLLWINKVNMYHPGQLIECQKAINLSKTLVKDWLQRYMFGGMPDAQQRAGAVADWLGEHNNFLTHGRPIGIEQARAHGLVVDALEEDQAFQEAVLSVFHATVATFLVTPCVKMVENDAGRGAFILVEPASGPRS